MIKKIIILLTLLLQSQIVNARHSDTSIDGSLKDECIQARHNIEHIRLNYFKNIEKYGALISKISTMQSLELTFLNYCHKNKLLKAK